MRVIMMRNEKNCNDDACKYKNNFIELKALGMGAFSTVFESKNKNDNTVYAIKKVSFDLDKRESVAKELNFLSTLDSNYVVKYIDSWIEPNYYIGSYTEDNSQNISSSNKLFDPNLQYLLHIQMELCPLTLRDAIKCIKKECLTSVDKTLSLIGYYIASELFIEILECVQYLHSYNPPIIHRDLKPENILLTNFVNKRFIKLSDFGLSTFHEFYNQSHTKYAGTKNYRANEINTTSKYTTKADIYSLGIILHELINFDNSYIPKNYSTVIDTKFSSLIDLSEKILSPNPAKRPNCDELLREFQILRLKNEEIVADNQFMKIITNLTNFCSSDNNSNFIECFVQNKHLVNLDRVSMRDFAVNKNSKENYRVYNKYFTPQTHYDIIKDDSNEQIESTANLTVEEAILKKLQEFSIKEYIIKDLDSLATAEFEYLLVLKQAINLYEAQIRDYVDSKPSNEELENYHKIVEDKCLIYFLNEKKGKISEEFIAEMIVEIRNRTALVFQVYKRNNLKRIESVISEEKLNAEIAEQEVISNRLNEQKMAIETKLNDLKNKLFTVKDEAKVKESEQEMHSMEESTKMQKRIIEQNLEYLQRMTDIHKKYANEKIDRERKNNANIQQTMQQLRRPDFKLLGTSAVKDNISLIILSLSLYEQKMIAIVETNPSDTSLRESHEQVVNETLENILTDERITDTIREEISENLRKCFDQMFIFFHESNLVRIEKEETEINMRSNVEEQNKVKRMLDEHQKEIDRKLSYLRTELTFIKEVTKVRELELQMQLMVENATMQQSLMQKNLDDLTKIIKFQKNIAKDKEEIIYQRRNNRLSFKEDLRNFANIKLNSEIINSICSIALQTLPFLLILLKLTDSR